MEKCNARIEESTSESSREASKKSADRKGGVAERVLIAPREKSI